MTTLIEIENLTKTYHLGEQDVPVLRGVSMTVARGELVALTGASGSGKSTLMNILGCLDRPSSGRYVLDGEDVSGLSPEQRAGVRGRKIGFVFQSFNLLARTSALDNVLMPLTYSHGARLSPAAARERGMHLLERVGLADRYHHHPSQLSGGQMQRVAIARSLVNQPPLLLADEPTGNLDSRTRVEIMDMLAKLNDEGLTVLIVTHDPEVSSFARRAVRMRDGIIEAGAFAHEPSQVAEPQLTGAAP